MAETGRNSIVLLHVRAAALHTCARCTQAWGLIEKVARDGGIQGVATFKLSYQCCLSAS